MDGQFWEQLTVDTNATPKEMIANFDNYSVRVEYNDDLILLHLPKVDNFSRDMYKSMKKNMFLFGECLRSQGRDSMWVAVPNGLKSLKKLVERLGFKQRTVLLDHTVYEKGLI